MIKTPSKLGLEGNILNLIKIIYKKVKMTAANIIPTVRNLKLSHYDQVQGKDNFSTS